LGGERYPLGRPILAHLIKPPEGYAGVVITTWEPTTADVLRLPSGRLVRGRGLRRPVPAGPVPAFALYLLGHRPPLVAWESRWLHWPDFWLPSDRAATAAALAEAWTRAEVERVEVACPSGCGRTGTALACLAVLDGIPTTRPSPMSGDITLQAPWRRPGSAASSPASSSGRSQQPEPSPSSRPGGPARSQHRTTKRVRAWPGQSTAALRWLC